MNVATILAAKVNAVLTAKESTKFSEIVAIHRERNVGDIVV